MGDIITTSFNIFLMLIIILSNNVNMSSVLSKEGNAYYHLKTSPIKLKLVIMSKLFLNVIFSVASIITTSIIFFNFSKIGFWNSMFVCLIVIFVYLGHLLWSMETDILNPKYKNYNNGISYVVNPNESFSIFLAFFISLIIFGITLFLMLERYDIALIKILLISAVFVFVRIWLFINNSKIYFKEM